jgi:hypothetical protein
MPSSVFFSDSKFPSNIPVIGYSKENNRIFIDQALKTFYTKNKLDF